MTLPECPGKAEPRRDQGLPETAIERRGRGEENQPERVHVRQPLKAQLERLETLFLCEIQGSEPAPALGPILNPSERRQLFEYHSVLGTKLLSYIKSLNSYSNPMRYTVVIPFYRKRNFTQGRTAGEVVWIQNLFSYPLNSPGSPLLKKRKKKKLNLPPELEKPMWFNG